MTAGSQLTYQGIELQVFLEEFGVLIDGGSTVATICGKLDAQPKTIATRLRRAGLQELQQRWERKCRAAGVDV